MTPRNQDDRAPVHEHADVQGELENFARYCASVAEDSMGLRRLTWKERTEWAASLAHAAGQAQAEVERLKEAQADVVRVGDEMARMLARSAATPPGRNLLISSWTEVSARVRS